MIISRGLRIIIAARVKNVEMWNWRSTCERRVRSSRSTHLRRRLHSTAWSSSQMEMKKGRPKFGIVPKVKMENMAKHASTVGGIWRFSTTSPEKYALSPRKSTDCHASKICDSGVILTPQRLRRSQWTVGLGASTKNSSLSFHLSDTILKISVLESTSTPKVLVNFGSSL